MDLVGDTIKHWERLEGERGTFLHHWQMIANYLFPDRADFTVHRSPGQRRMYYVYDNSPIYALLMSAAGLHGLLTSPTLPWFSYRADPSPGANWANDPDLDAWLQEATEADYALFNSPKHNFASQSHELYMDELAFGTAVMAVLESPRSGILFSTRHLRECVIEENEEDRVDTLIRHWKWTPAQAVAAWGNAAGEKVLKAFADGKTEKMEFIHSVKPRRQRNPDRGRESLHKPFESVYISMADKTIITQGGFDSFPYLVPRFSKTVGETWGRGPGTTCLDDIMMLNAMRQTVLKAAQKIVDPTLMVPDDGFVLPIKTFPGAMNYYRAGSKDRIEPLVTQGNIQVGVELISDLRQQIASGMMVDWMNMPADPSDPSAAGKGITATYTLQQRDEKMRLLSPMLARLQSEFLGPLLDRVFDINWRRSVSMNFAPGSPYPAPPPALRNARIRVEYVSPIALAQRSSQLDGVGRVIQMALQFAQAGDMQALQTLDIEAIMRLTGKDLGTPVQILKSADRLAQEKQQAAEAQQAMNGHDQLASLAGSAKDGAQALQTLASTGAAQGGGQAAPAAVAA